MKFYRFITAAIIIMVASVSCEKKPSQETSDFPSSFRFTINSIRLFEQDQYQLKLQYAQHNSGSGSITWTDYDLTENKFGITFRSMVPSVATVSKTGLVSTLAEGTSLIYADCGDKEKLATFKITVRGANADSLAVVHADWGWKAIGKNGAEEGYSTFTLFDKTASISVVRYPISSYTTSVFEKGGASSYNTTSVLASSQNALFAINGGYFNTTTFYSNTFLSKDGSIISSSSDSEYNNRSDALLGIFTGRKSLEIIRIDPSKYQDYAKTYADAIAAGPLLVSGGKKVQHTKTTDFYTVSHPRTMFGYDKKGYAWMIVIDGRFAGKGDGATVEEETKICYWLGLTDAMNFDGGGSSTLWTSTSGVLNHPCDNSKFDHAGERKVPNIIMVK